MRRRKGVGAVIGGALSPSLWLVGPIGGEGGEGREMAGYGGHRRAKFKQGAPYVWRRRPRQPPSRALHRRPPHAAACQPVSLLLDGAACMFSLCFCPCPSMLDGSCSGLSVFSFILGGNYCQCSFDHSVHLAYQPPVSNTFLSVTNQTNRAVDCQNCHLTSLTLHSSPTA